MPLKAFTAAPCAPRRPARDNFLGGDPHDVNMPIISFAVVARQDGVVDMATIEQAASANICARRATAQSGIDPAHQDVIVAHMHTTIAATDSPLMPRSTSRPQMA
jgi:hypothetical protein